MKYHIALFLLLISMCCSNSKKRDLPIYGRKEIKEILIDEKISYDTIDHKVKDFSFLNQDSLNVDNNTFKNSIYVADFFFTTCPTICPIMKNNMIKVYDYFENESNVKFLSHTINPDFDDVRRLKKYSNNLGVSSNKWHFVTGNIDSIYSIAKKSYMVTTIIDQDEPGGFLHSGTFLLVDKKRRIRGVYDGTDKAEMNKLINDIKILIN